MNRPDGFRQTIVRTAQFNRAGPDRTSLFGLLSGHLFVVLTSPRSLSDGEIADQLTFPGVEPLMNTYPAGEQRISEVERGRSCRAIVPLAHGETISAGDTVLFALSNARPGQQPEFVKGGDSVLVVLTDVFDLGTADPASGQPLVELSWKPLGQGDPPVSLAKRGGRPAARRHG